MKNRELMKKIAMEELPAAESFTAQPPKRRRFSRVAIATACAVAVLVGCIGTAAATGILAIGPAAQTLESMTPEERANARENPPPFDLDAEIAAIEEYIPGLEVITDFTELVKGETYNALSVGTVGTGRTFLFSPYDPTLFDKLRDPEISTSVWPMECLGQPSRVNGEIVHAECDSDKFTFVRLGSGSSIKDNRIESFYSVEMHCAECGARVDSPIVDTVHVSEFVIPEGAIAINIKAYGRVYTLMVDREAAFNPLAFKTVVLSEEEVAKDSDKPEYVVAVIYPPDED